MNERLNETAMLEESGTVIAIEGDYAVIETQRVSACGHCNVGESCGTSVLAGIFGNSHNQVRLINHLGLLVGDTAIIGINQSVLLITAVLAYMLPLILMIAFSVIANLSMLSDGINFIFSLLGLFTGMQITNRIMRNKEYQAQEIILLRSADNEANKQANEQLVPFVAKKLFNLEEHNNE